MRWPTSKRRLAFAPPHLSAYHLTIEPNTYFHRFPPQLPDDDTAAAMQDAIEARLAEAGYEHYESPLTRSGPVTQSRVTSHACTRDSRCAAQSQLLDVRRLSGHRRRRARQAHFPDRIVRQVRVKHRRATTWKRWSGAAPCRRSTRSSGAARIRVHDERAAPERRLSRCAVRGAHGPAADAVLRELDEAERRGLIVRDHERIAPTPLGRRFLNDLLQIFLAEAPRHAKVMMPSRDYAATRSSAVRTSRICASSPTAVCLQMPARSSSRQDMERYPFTDEEVLVRQAQN